MSTTTTIHPTFGAHGEDEVAVHHADPECPFIAFGDLSEPYEDSVDCRFCIGGDNPRSLGKPSALDRYTAGGDTETFNSDNASRSRSGGSHSSGPGKPYEERLAEVVAWLTNLGRKVEIVDVDHARQRVAQEWLRRYEGDNEFLNDVRARGRNLTVPQAKGVLNCLRAELVYGPRKAETPAATEAPALDALAILNAAIGA